MSVETEHFFFRDTVFKTVGRKPLGRPAGPEAKVGITATTAQCKKCGETWRAGLVGPGKIKATLTNAMMFDCPSCGQDETVRLEAFL